MRERRSAIKRSLELPPLGRSPHRVGGGPTGVSSGKDVLLLAVAYQVCSRWADIAPLRDNALDHATHVAEAAGWLAKASRQ